MSSDVYKIAVVIPKYGLVGGAEGFAAELTERIAANDRYEIHVFANKWLNESPRITFHRIPIISFPKFLTPVSFAYFAGLRISRMNFDLIHTHERIFTADLFTMHGIPHRVWVTEVRNKSMSLFDVATRWVEKCLVRNQRCKRFLTVSRLAQDKFLQEYNNVDNNRVQVIHPGVDVQRFRKLKREFCREEVRKNLGIDSKELIILFVSMNFEIKGLAELMAGLAKFKSKCFAKTFRLLIIGKGNVKRFGRLAQQLGIKEHVLFLGVVPKETLDRIYLAGDIFSLLSRFDTFGMVVLEAMAASLPVIISGNVGAKDLVSRGINGFVLDQAFNPDEIADKIGLLAKEEPRPRIAEAAFKTASMYTWEYAARKMENIYEELLGDGSL